MCTRMEEVQASWFSSESRQVGQQEAGGTGMGGELKGEGVVASLAS